MIDFLDILKLTYRNFQKNKLKVALTLFGIILGIFTFLFFLFVSNGLKDVVEKEFTALGSNKISIRYYEDVRNGPPLGTGIDEKILRKVSATIKDYKYFHPGIFYNSKIKYKKTSHKFLLIQFDRKGEKIDEVDYEMEFGRDLKKNDKSSIIFGSTAAKKFYENTDDKDRQIKVGEKVTIKNKKFKVVGIIKESGDLFLDTGVYVSFEDIKELSNQKDTYSIIVVYYKSGTDLEKEKENLDLKLNGHRAKEKKYIFSTPKEMVKKISGIINGLTFVILFISAISLLVAGINILNMMYSNTIERINEISIFKAFGATNKDIGKLFLFESSLFGIFGSVIGFFLAFILTKIISILITKFSDYTFIINFDLKIFLITLIVSTIFSIIFGLYPAIKAAKTNPSENLKDD